MQNDQNCLQYGCFLHQAAQLENGLRAARPYQTLAAMRIIPNSPDCQFIGKSINLHFAPPLSIEARGGAKSGDNDAKDFSICRQTAWSNQKGALPPGHFIFGNNGGHGLRSKRQNDSHSYSEAAKCH